MHSTQLILLFKKNFISSTCAMLTLNFKHIKVKGALAHVYLQQSTNTCTFVEQSTTFVDHKHMYKKIIWFPLADKAKRRLYHHMKASLSMHRNENVVTMLHVWNGVSTQTLVNHHWAGSDSALLSTSVIMRKQGKFIAHYTNCIYTCTCFNER